MCHQLHATATSTWWKTRRTYLMIGVKVKWSCYRPGVVQRVGRGIALLFHDRGTRRGWVVSGTPRSHFTSGKDPVSIVQEAGWAPGPIWTGGKSHPHRDSIPDRPARSQSLYRLSYPAMIGVTPTILTICVMHCTVYSNLVKQHGQQLSALNKHTK